MAFKKLIDNKGKIEKIVVGIHFYQTHPDFIESFLDEKAVRYIMQPEGTFHPKLFLFYNSNNDWEALIGRANFTHSAFNLNTEICSLISSKDKGSINVLSDIFNTMDLIWKESKRFNNDKLINYRKTWENYRSKINSLSGNYGGSSEKRKRKSKAIHLVPVANMGWKEFMEKVNNEQYHNLDSRLKVLNIARSLFEKVDSFKELKDDERKFIAGTPNKLKVDSDVYYGYFGSMRGAGFYMKRIIENDIIFPTHLMKSLCLVKLQRYIMTGFWNRIKGHLLVIL